jgi:hypothetical protein
MRRQCRPQEEQLIIIKGKSKNKKKRKNKSTMTLKTILVHNIE